MPETKGGKRLDCDRLFDLVRFMRAELLDADLITREEYAHLLVEGGKVGVESVARLHGYDELRAQLTAQAAKLEAAEKERDKLEIRLIGAHEDAVAKTKALVNMVPAERAEAAEAKVEAAERLISVIESKKVRAYELLDKERDCGGPEAEREVARLTGRVQAFSEVLTEAQRLLAAQAVERALSQPPCGKCGESVSAEGIYTCPYCGWTQSALSSASARPAEQKKADGLLGTAANANAERPAPRRETDSVQAPWEDDDLPMPERLRRPAAYLEQFEGCWLGHTDCLCIVELLHEAAQSPKCDRCHRVPPTLCAVCAEQLTAAGADAGAPAPRREVEIAERIARTAHAGQKDTVTGEPYITHVERVVALVEGDDAKAVAWLHDVIEDSIDITYGELRRAGISEPVIRAVRLVTREDPYEYSAYIESIRISSDPLALAVKIADLRDHLRPNCPERLRPRYVRALGELSTARVQEQP